MNLTQTGKVLEMAWRLKLGKKVKDLPIFTLVGETGVGKSATLYQLFEEIKREHNADFFEDKFLAQVEVGDLVGMMDVQADKTAYKKPEWWPEPGQSGILFFDELADAAPDVQKAIMPLLLTGKLHQHVLPENVLIVCAMNPIGGEYGGRMFSKQFRDRLAFLKIEPSIEEWLAFAEREGLPVYGRNLVAEQPDFFQSMKKGNSEEEDWTTNPYYEGAASQRSYTSALQVYAAMTDDEKESVAIDVLSAIAGHVAAASIISYSRRGATDLINIKDIYNEDKFPAVLNKLSVWIEAGSAEKVGSFLRLFKAELKNMGLDKAKLKIIGKIVSTLSEEESYSILKYIKEEVKSGTIMLKVLSSDSGIYSRIDKVLNPGRHTAEAQAADETSLEEVNI